jgi:hypothetical protein
MLAHCLYVLTDDNYPAISDIRADASYLTCLLDIVRPREVSYGKGKEPSDQRSVTLGVLVAGAFAVLSSCLAAAITDFIRYLTQHFSHTSIILGVIYRH